MSVGAGACAGIGGATCDFGRRRERGRPAARPPLQGILGHETRPLVSSDFARDPRSAIVDALSTRVVDGRMVKVMAWYDNEWGYVNRMVDLAERLSAECRP